MVHPVYSAIHAAADGTKVSIVPSLFHKGADIKFKQADGGMTLHQAAYLDLQDMARLLVQHNANAVVIWCSNGSPYGRVTDRTKEDCRLPSTIHY